jgi:hypothetical protein
MTLVVNSGYLIRFLAPLIGMADVDDPPAELIVHDPNNDDELRAFVRTQLVPNHERWKDFAKHDGKIALSWFLTCAPEKAEGYFNSVLPPWPAPDEPLKIFQMIWEELYGDESWEFEPGERFKVKSRGDLLNGMYKPPTEPTGETGVAN